MHCRRSVYPNPTPPDQDFVFKVAKDFFDLVVGEFYVTLTTNTPGALANYQAFIKGFEHGLLSGAAALFASVFEEAYTVGYLGGFRGGYSQGYAAGYKAGYAAGYSAGQPNWITDRNTIVKAASSLLGDAHTVTTIYSDAVTVGTVLAALF